MILGRNYEPYAVQTDLGWSVVGSSTCNDAQSVAGLCHRVTIKEFPLITPADAIRILESDFKEASGDGNTVSKDDISFLNVAARLWPK